MHPPVNAGCRGTVDATLRGWRSAVIENRALRLTVLVEKGASVVELLYKPLDLDLTYRTLRDIPPRDQQGLSYSTADGAFTDSYEGGWQEVLPNGGPATEYGGTVFPQHGESAAISYAARLDPSGPESITLHCAGQTSILPLRVTRSFRLDGDDAALLLETEVTNLTATRVPLSWGMHLAFGAPFVGPGASIELPAGTTVHPHPHTVYPSGRRLAAEDSLWPRAVDSAGTPVDLTVLPPRGTKSDLVYLRPPEGWYRLHSAAHPVTAEIEWDLARQPCLWFWQEFGAVDTYPWWGSEYVIGLEPFTGSVGSGLADAVAAQQVLWLEPGATTTARYRVAVQERSGDA